MAGTLRTDVKEHSRPPLPVRFYYGWIIVVTAAFTMAVVYGFRYSFSVFFVAILDEFGWERASTAAILSVNIFVYGLFVVPAGVLVDRFGPRIVIPLGAVILTAAIILSSRASAQWHFFLLFGVIGAVGIAMAGYVPNFVVLTNWFVKRRGTAFGVAQAGNGGSFVLAGLAQVLIATVGWRNAYVVLGSVFGGLVVLLTVFLLRRYPRDLGLEPDGDSAEDAVETRPRPRHALQVVDEAWVNTRWTVGLAVRTRRFWALFFANMLLWGFGFALLVTHQAAYARDVGHEPSIIALMVGMYGVVNIVGNLLGFLSDRYGREPVYTLGIVCASLGVVALLLAADPGRGWLLLAYSALFGLGLGLVAPSQSASLADLFQGPNFGSINGLAVTSFGIGGSIGPWLAGFIYDQAQTYVPAFLLSLASILLACALIWVARPSAVRAVRRA